MDPILESNPYYFSLLIRPKPNSIPNPISQHHKNRKMLNLVSNESCGSYARFSGESILCYDSCTDSYVRQGNNQFWNEVKFDIPNRVWKNIKNLGVTGDKDDEVYVKIIIGMEEIY